LFLVSGSGGAAWRGPDVHGANAQSNARPAHLAGGQGGMAQQAVRRHARKKVAEALVRHQ